MTTMTRHALKNQSVIWDTTTFLFFWSAAATLVAMAHWIFDPISPAASFAAKGAVILLAAWGYIWSAGVRTSVAHALLIGVAWAFLDILAELTISTMTGHTWFALLDSPSRPYWRDALLFTWIAGPALFAHEV